jgi:hypothetical protein
MSVTQTFVPSKTAPARVENPVAIVVTVQGRETPGVTIETLPVPMEEPLATQIFAPSNASALGLSPRFVTTVVTTPAGWSGTSRRACPG